MKITYCKVAPYEETGKLNFCFLRFLNLWDTSYFVEFSNALMPVVKILQIITRDTTRQA